MPRKLRLEFPDAMYHVMSRGDQREDIFLCDMDRYDFLKTLAEACRKTDWQVHAFCLIRNHYHLVHGIQGDTPAGRAEYDRQMEQRRLEEVDEDKLQEFRNAWFLGSEIFRKECLQQMEDKVGENHPGEIRHETAEAKAERLIDEELARLQWNRQALAVHSKSDPRNLAIAARLRQETTLSIKEIAERLHLGKPKGAKTKSPQTAQPSSPHQH